jgi:chromosome partitioning protein
VALSQHGTVAPVTLHHRVDFAASMVDGRTVGEIVPKSASAREICELWSYIQFRLSKLMRDPKLIPEFLPQDRAVAPLLAAVDELPAEEPPATDDIVTVEPPPFYVGPERRLAAPSAPYAGAERRAGTFGRRQIQPAYHQDETGGRK